MKIAYVTDSGTGKSITELAKDGIISIPVALRPYMGGQEVIKPTK